jgi:hypothetical protein
MKIHHRRHREHRGGTEKLKCKSLNLILQAVISGQYLSDTTKPYLSNILIPQKNRFVEFYHDANEVLLTISLREVERQQILIALIICHL